MLVKAQRSWMVVPGSEEELERVSPPLNVLDGLETLKAVAQLGKLID